MKSLLVLLSLTASFSSFAGTCLNKYINVEMPDGRVVMGELCAKHTAQGKNNSLLVDAPSIKLPGYYKSIELPLAPKSADTYCQTLGLKSVIGKTTLTSKILGGNKGLYPVNENELKVYKLGTGLFVSSLVCSK